MKVINKKKISVICILFICILAIAISAFSGFKVQASTATSEENLNILQQADNGKYDTYN